MLEIIVEIVPKKIYNYIVKTKIPRKKEKDMKILKLSINGLQNLKNTLNVDFVAQQRVDNDAKEQMFHVFSNIYTSPTLSFIGINASGKTTILKLISFALGLLNNEPINSISSKEFLDDLDSKQNIIFTAYFYHNGIVYKLETVVGRKINSIDGNTKFVIIDETLYEKEIHKVKTKKVFMILMMPK